MHQTAQIEGCVEYREGDGPAIPIREGAVDVAVTDIDATLSWADGDNKYSAALPIDDFRRYVQEGCICLNAGTAMRRP